MILAHVNVPRVTVPKVVKERSRGWYVEISFKEVPFDGHAWIMCRCAYPHDDGAHYGDYMLLTLSMRSGNAVGDARMPSQGGDGAVPAPRGTLFVVDPRVTHWLCCTRPGPPIPWYGVQWELPRRYAASRARKIVSNLMAQYGGRWREPMGSLYRAWYPESQTTNLRKLRGGEPVRE